MDNLTRVTQEIFGEDAGVEERSQIGSFASGEPVYTTDPAQIQSLDNFKQGLNGCVVGENSPVMEEINSLYFLITRQLAYLFQKGIAEWIGTTTYHTNSVVIHNGAVYISLTDDNENNNPATDLVNWKLQGNNFDANLINGRVVPLVPCTANAFTKLFTASHAGFFYSQMLISRDGKFLMYTDDTLNVGFNVVDFNSKKFSTISAVTISAQPTGLASALAESPDERFYAVGSDTSPFVYFYERVGSTFTKLANPGTLPVAGSVIESASWSPDGTVVAFCGSAGGKLVIYRRDGKTFYKVTDPATMPPDFCTSVKFSPDGNFLALLCGDPRTLYIYKITYDASGLPVFTHVPNSIVFTISNLNSLDWHPDSSCLFVADTLPRVLLVGIDGTVTEEAQTEASGLGFTSRVDVSPDGKSVYIFGFLPGVIGAIRIMNFNTITKQLTYLQDIGEGFGAQNYMPIISQNNKHMIVKRYDGVDEHIDIYENPNSVDVYNKNPLIRYKSGLN